MEDLDISPVLSGGPDPERHAPTQGNLYYRFVRELHALLKVEASVSILLLFSVFLFPKRYEQDHFS